MLPKVKLNYVEFSVAILSLAGFLYFLLANVRIPVGSPIFTKRDGNNDTDYSDLQCTYAQVYEDEIPAHSTSCILKNFCRYQKQWLFFQETPNPYFNITANPKGASDFSLPHQAPIPKEKFAEYFKKPFPFVHNNMKGDLLLPLPLLSTIPDRTWLLDEQEQWFMYPRYMHSITLNEFAKLHKVDEVVWTNTPTLHATRFDPTNLGHLLADDFFAWFEILRNFQYEERPKGLKVLFSFAPDEPFLLPRCIPKQFDKKKCDYLMKKFEETFYYLIIPKKQFKNYEVKTEHFQYLTRLDNQPNKMFCYRHMIAGLGDKGFHNMDPRFVTKPTDVYSKMVLWNYYKAWMLGLIQEHFPQLTSSIQNSTLINERKKDNIRKKFKFTVVIKEEGGTSWCFVRKQYRPTFKTRIYKIFGEQVESIRFVEWQHYTLPQQMEIILDTDVLITPPGAACFMSMFLKRGSVMMVVNFTNNNIERWVWSQVSDFKTLQIEDSCITMNWDLFEKQLINAQTHLNRPLLLN